jgi:predicted nuclease with TOPRIM domain
LNRDGRLYKKYNQRCHSNLQRYTFLIISKVIEFLINNLPGIDSTKEDQLEKMKELQEENDRLAKECQLELDKTLDLLEKVKHIEQEIISDQLQQFKAL